MRTPLKVLGLVGWPVGHSVSPPMHNAAFAAAGIDAAYTVFAVPPQNLAVAMAGIRALGLLGCNVTVPHKEAVLPLLDAVAPSAARVGAVNTVVNKDGRLIGHNTDGEGFLQSLAQAGVEVAGKRAVVLGAGGSARAVAVYLVTAGVRALTVLARNPDRAVALAAAVTTTCTGGSVGSSGVVGGGTSAQCAGVALGGPAAAAALAAADLVVNCTPVGMAPEMDATPLPDLTGLAPTAVVTDIVFNPVTTRLLAEARAAGHRVIDGVGMLAHQGAAAWRYWFGRPGPAAAMEKAARAALRG